MCEDYMESLFNIYKDDIEEFHKIYKHFIYLGNHNDAIILYNIVLKELNIRDNAILVPLAKLIIDEENMIHKYGYNSGAILYIVDLFSHKYPESINCLKDLCLIHDWDDYIYFIELGFF